MNRYINLLIASVLFFVTACLAGCGAGSSGDLQPPAAKFAILPSHYTEASGWVPVAVTDSHAEGPADGYWDFGVVRADEVPTKTDVKLAGGIDVQSITVYKYNGHNKEEVLPEGKTYVLPRGWYQIEAQSLNWGTLELYLNTW